MCLKIVKFNRNNFPVAELKRVRLDSDILQVFIKRNNVILEALKLEVFELGNEDPGISDFNVVEPEFSIILKSCYKLLCTQMNEGSLPAIIKMNRDSKRIGKY